MEPNESNRPRSNARKVNCGTTCGGSRGAITGRFIRTAFCVPAAIVLFAACTEKTNNAEQQAQRTEAAGKLDQAANQLEQNLQLLAREAERFGEKAKQEFSETSTRMEEEIRKIHDRADYLRNNADKEWEKVRTELDAAMKNLQTEFDQLRSKIAGPGVKEPSSS